MKNYNKRIILLISLGMTLILFLSLILWINRSLSSFDERLRNLEVEKFFTASNVISFALPDNLQFAGEIISMNRADLRERMDREMLSNIYGHSRTIALMKRAHHWLPQFQKILKEENIPDDFKYMPLIESALQDVRSPRGASGFWQILRRTGIELGLEVTTEVDERYNPIKATYAACKYLRKAYKKFNNWTLVAASYNMGMYGVKRELVKQKVNSYYDLLLNEETSRYVFRILAIQQIIENPQLYGFNIASEHLYTTDSLVYVEVDKTIPNLIDFAIQQGTSYKVLKFHNAWLRKNRLTVRRGKKYRIAIPYVESPKK